MTAIVEVQDLKKKYDGRDEYAVNDVSFEINQGEIFSLLGPNGAGKTTTISMMSCLLEPSAGDARIGGHSVRKEAMAVKKLIGVVPQEIALYETLNARQNLSFWGQLYGLGGKQLNQAMDRVLEQVSLTDRAKDRVNTYSGGMKRRLNIAVGLLHNPKVLYMDEPTVGIDPQSRRKILDTVKALNAQGMTVIYTTHYMEEAEELSNRVGIIDHGRLIAIGSQEELVDLVGQEEGLRIAFGEGIDLQPIASQLDSLDEVLQAAVVDGSILLTVKQAEMALASVSARLNDLGVKMRSVVIEEPNLEAVFLHLTGRALRD